MKLSSGSTLAASIAAMVVTDMVLLIVWDFVDLNRLSCCHPTATPIGIVTLYFAIAVLLAVTFEFWKKENR